MRRLILASFVILAGFLRAAEVATSAAAPLSPRNDSTPAAENNPANTSPAQRVVSPDTAAKLAAAAPKFTEPAPEPPSSTPPSPVVRAPDRARTQIVQLPEFRVGEPRLNVPDSLEVLTPKGRVALGFELHPGLRMVPFRRLNAIVALELLDDDLQAQRRARAAELLNLYAIR